MQTATIGSIHRPTGAVVVWIASLHEVIPASVNPDNAGGTPDWAGGRLDHQAGRLVLRSMLAYYLGEKSVDVEPVPDARGKPRLFRRDGSRCALEVNISHSRTHVAVAISRCGPVGIDTESRQLSRGQLRSIPARILPREAAERFATLSPGSQANQLLSQWCAREALLKALGEGLTRDPRTVGLPVPLPSSPTTIEGHMVQVICTGPIVSLAHPVLDGRSLRHGTRPFHSYSHSRGEAGDSGSWLRPP